MQMNWGSDSSLLRQEVLSKLPRKDTILPKDSGHGLLVWRAGRGLQVSAGILSEFVFTSAPFLSCHASTIAESPEGVIVAFFAGTKEGAPDVGIWLSRKVGEEWEAPREVANGIAEDGGRYPCWNPVLFQAEQGPLMLFYKVGPTCPAWWGMLMLSDDCGQTWGKPRRLADKIWGPSKNKPIQLGDGSIFCPSSSECTGWQVFLQRTSDLGTTWENIGPLNDGNNIAAIQPTILRYPAGRMQLLCRSKQGYIVTCWSGDNGQTWSPMEPTCLPNPNSGIDAVSLRDGRGLLVYNHTGMIAGRWGGLRSPLNVAVSADGASWQAAVVLEDAPGEYSYPAVIQTADNKVHVTYTWRRERIRHVVIDPSQLEPTAMPAGNWPK